MKRLVFFFDIDGTLILTGRAGQLALGDVVTERSGDESWTSQVAFAGRTDRSIISDFFRLYGIEDNDENFQFYRQRFLQALEEYLPVRTGQVLPGVVKTLECLAHQPSATLGLLTGNLQPAAWLKLRHYQLDHYFFTEEEQALGGFGDHHHDRDDVARDALADARRRLDGEIDPQDVWVIGDTPSDVQCARAIGANVLAVATGGCTQEELAAAEPDFLFPDLTHAAPWWSWLERESGVEAPAGK